MTIQLEEKTFSVGSHNAIYRTDRIEVFDEEWGTRLFSCPLHWTELDVGFAAKIYDTGRESGFREGQIDKAFGIRKALLIT